MKVFFAAMIRSTTLRAVTEVSALRSFVPTLLVAVVLPLVSAACQSGGGVRPAQDPPAVQPSGAFAEQIEAADADFDARRYVDALEGYKALYAAANSRQDFPVAGEAAAMVAATIAVMNPGGGPKVTEGDEWMARAEELSTDQNDGAWTRVLLARGVRSWTARDIELARGTFIYLYNYCFGRNRTPRAIQAARMASLASRGQEQVDWMRRAIEAARTTGRAEWEAPLWSELGRLHDQREELSAALDAFVRARQLVTETKVAPLIRMRADIEYGHGLWRAGRVEEALDQLEQSNAVVYSNYIRRPSPETAEMLATVLIELGEVYAANGDKERARTNFNAAHEKLIEAGDVNAAQGRARKLLARIDRLDAPSTDRIIPPKQR